MKGPFKYARHTHTDENGVQYVGALFHVSAEDRTESCDGLNQRQAKEVCALLNRLDAKGIGRRKQRLPAHG